MLDDVVAVRFHKPMDVGRTTPLLIVAQRADGQEVEMVAKFSKGADIGAGGLMREALCAMLASDLGLPVPEPFWFALTVHSVTRYAASILLRPRCSTAASMWALVPKN